MAARTKRPLGDPFGTEVAGAISPSTVPPVATSSLLSVRPGYTGSWPGSFSKTASARVQRLRGVDALDRFLIDVVLLDAMSPGTSAMYLCRILRTKSGIPILMVTVRGSEIDCVLGLELGADDYLLKPFDGSALVARTLALPRHSGWRQRSQRYR